MGVKGKLEAEVEIKSCGDAFHELFASKPHDISNISPDKIHACALHEGEFGKPGSVVCWDYTLDGKKSVAKEVITAMDVENKWIKFKVIEGDLLKEFKNIAITVHVYPRGETTAVKWTIDFESIDDGHYPTKLMDFAIDVTKNIEDHHLSA